MIVISRNFKFILNKLNCLIGIELLCCLCLFYFIDFSYIISIILGLFFSFLIILDFAVSEYAILHGGKKGAFFLFYLSRLFLYAIPLVVGLYFKNYFHFFVILISLFTYQVHYIGFEFFRSLKKIKRQDFNG
tara:strand:+ start:833 stop:1228 length:396 start_codon:yes stop_codon:yes gene_type:complete